MEAIIKRRHPNSIPAIMYAAAAVSETDPPTKSSTVSFLERRIQKLECDLESKDEEAKKSLRSMEQQFLKVKVTLLPPYNYSYLEAFPSFVLLYSRVFQTF